MGMMIDPHRFAAGGAGGLNFVGGSIAASTNSISLTTLGGGIDSEAREGDLVICCYAEGNSSDTNVTMSTAGYTEIADLRGADLVQDINLGVFYKFMGATPDTDAVATVGDTDQVIGVYVFRGVDASTPLDVAVVTGSGSNSGVANPPAITPVTAGAEIMAIGGSSGPTLFTEPAGMENFLQATDVIVLGFAHVTWDGSGAYDPPSFGGSTSTSYGHAELTIALRPAP